jgi:hypothetical protein
MTIIFGMMLNFVVDFIEPLCDMIHYTDIKHSCLEDMQTLTLHVRVFKLSQSR